MRIIYFVRHGLTQWNEDSAGKFQTHSNGRGNVLTKAGFQQTAIAGKILANEDIQYGYHSNFTRSKQTLDGISLYLGGIDFILEPRLDEKSLDFLDGMTEEEWVEQFPETKVIFDARRADKYATVMPKMDFSICYEKAMQIAGENGEPDKIIPPWESYKDLVERLKPFIDELDEGRHLISGHLGVNRAGLANLLAGTEYLPRIEQIADMKIPNGAVYRVDDDSGSVKVYHNTGDGWLEGLIE